MATARQRRKAVRFKGKPLNGNRPNDNRPSGRTYWVSGEDNVFTPEITGEEKDRPFLAALRATVGIGPGTAVVVTTVAYTALQVEAFRAIIAGVVAAGLAWLIAAVFAQRCVAPNSADSVNYRHIREKYQRLLNRLVCLYPKIVEVTNGGAVTVDGEDNKNLVCKQVWRESNTIRAGLDPQKQGMPWATGMGYVELWRRIHRAEEALIKVQPLDEVLGGAMRDEARLAGSNMTNKKPLLKRLRRAVAVLDSTDKELSYLEEPEPAKGSEELGQINEELRQKARNILSEIRYQINYFRDQGAEGIVLARNRLVGTSAAVGAATFALLALAIVSDASPRVILLAAAYFLVGALTGLFARSQAEWTADVAVRDFGLSTARLVHIPWLSGLAAVAGVLICSVIDTQFLDHAVTTGLTLNQIFDSYRPPFFIVAAVFGLTPDLVIRRLTEQADRYKGDLASTETSQSTKSNQKKTSESE